MCPQAKCWMTGSLSQCMHKRILEGLVLQPHLREELTLSFADEYLTQVLSSEQRCGGTDGTEISLMN